MHMQRTKYSETSDKGHSEIGQTSQQKEQAKSAHVYACTLYRKSPPKEDEMARPESVLYNRFHRQTTLRLYKSYYKKKKPKQLAQVHLYLLYNKRAVYKQIRNMGFYYRR